MLVLVMTLMLAAEPEQSPDQVTRAQEHQSAREEKAQKLEPPKRTFVEKALHRVKEDRIMERFKSGWKGFHPLIGGMPSGAGFAFGTSYSAGNVAVTAQHSLNGYQRYTFQLSAPPAMSGRLSARLRSEYRNYSQEDFFGVGNDSRKEDRANYRLEDQTIAGEVDFKLRKHIKVGGSLGWIHANVGSGTETIHPSLEQTAYAATLRAFDNQPRYLETAAFLDVDSRDEPGNPRSGARYLAKWSAFHDQNLGQYGFNRFDVDVQKYIPFLNERRVIALRARTSLTQADDGQQIPFYMLPALGGSQDLRGFSSSRFRDRNMVVFNAEYRWEAFSGLDLALFADAGQVSPRVGDFRLDAMKTAGGIGFRFNTAKSVFCRLDVGYSHEGPRVFLSFGHVF